MRSYEVLFITRPDYDEEKVNAILARYQDIVKKHNGTIKSAGKWEKRRLAYEIDGLREGLYLIMTFDGPQTAAAELDRVMKIDQDVVRHMISRTDIMTRKPTPPRPRRRPRTEEGKTEDGQETKTVSEESAEPGAAQAETNNAEKSPE